VAPRTETAIQPDEESRQIRDAVAARRGLEDLLDRLTGSPGLDPHLLAELARFIESKALPAAHGYEGLLAASLDHAGGRRWAGCRQACGTQDFTCPEIRAFDSVERELEAGGYAPHTNRIDARVVQCFPCMCGRLLAYVGAKRPGSYRFFGVCRPCGHWLEW
jgi:hypothetical protein